MVLLVIVDTILGIADFLLNFPGISAVFELIGKLSAGIAEFGGFAPEWVTAGIVTIGGIEAILFVRGFIKAV